MTEDQYQKTREVMQRANGFRSLITTRKGIVGKWVAMEADAKEKMQPNKVEGFRKLTESALKMLDKARKDFSDLKLPDENFTKTINRCKECGAKIKDEKSIYCPSHTYLLL